VLRGRVDNEEDNYLGGVQTSPRLLALAQSGDISRRQPKQNQSGQDADDAAEHEWPAIPVLKDGSGD